jgi:L-iditol 2-dehydrogenase
LAAVDVTQNDLSEVVRAHTAGAGVDLALECSGAAASARACFDSLRPLGRYTQVGHFGRDVELNFDHVAFKQLQVNGSVGYTAQTWSRTLRILEQGRLAVAEIISHRLPLDRWREGFELCERKEALKVLLLPAA